MKIIKPGAFCYRVDLGRRDYREVWALQKKLVECRQSGTIPDVLLLVEHPPTYTLGRGGKPEHLLIGEEELAELGAVMIPTDRGGDMTYHGPGQIVGYPIVDLAELEPDVHLYLRSLEEVLIRTLARFGIDTTRVDGFTGVWHERGKVAAIGVRVARWVTSHGFALNVKTDLAYFERIIPCGIVGKAVASMESIVEKRVSMDHVADVVVEEFGSVLRRSMRSVSEDDLLREINVKVG